MFDAAIDTAETAVRGPAAKYAAATGIGYTASRLRHATEPYRQDSMLGDNAFLTAGLLTVEEYLAADPATFTGFVSGSTLASRHTADKEGDDEDGGGGSSIAALLEP